MSTVTPSFWKAVSGNSGSTTSVNPYVNGHNNSSYIIEGALYSLNIQMTNNYRIDTITVNVGTICSDIGYGNTNVYILIYTSDPTSNFTTYDAPTPVYSGYQQYYINGSAGTSNISVTVPTAILTTGTYYLFVTTDCTTAYLNAYKYGNSISVTISESVSSQPGAWIKINGVWKFATVWIKINGVWKVSTPWIKRSGVWKRSQT